VGLEAPEGESRAGRTLRETSGVRESVLWGQHYSLDWG
jgi:hypothetical protein